MSLSPACFTPGPEHTYSDRSRRPRGTLKCNLTLCSIFPAFTLVHSLQKKTKTSLGQFPPPIPHPPHILLYTIARAINLQILSSFP